MSDSHSNPLSLKNLLAGIIVTVIGGVILTFILQGTLFSPQTSEENPVPADGGAQVVEVIVTTPPAEVIACPGAPQKRLSVGANALVCTASETIILRSGPRRSASAIGHLVPGTRLVVIGEAICDETSQWWYWEVRTDGDLTGWVSEGGDEVDPYFVCPGN